MTKDLTYIAARPGELYWRNGPCHNLGAKVLLLTIGGVVVVGQWYGKVGSAFTHWCPLPKHGAPQPSIATAPLWARVKFAFQLVFQPRSLK